MICSTESSSTVVPLSADVTTANESDKPVLTDKRQQIHTDSFNPFSRIESMTTVIGIKCKEGIVLASDSQGTSDDEKTKVKKISNINNTSIGIGFSGYDDNIRDFIRNSNIGTKIDSEKDLREQLYKITLEFVKPTLSFNSEADSVKTIWVYSPIKLFMLTGAFINQKFYLYQIQLDDSQQPSIHVNLFEGSYGSIGSGKTLASLVLNQQSRYTEFINLDVNITIGLALYIIDDIKQIDPKSGNDTQISVIDKNGYREISKEDYSEYYRYYIQNIHELLYENSTYVNNRKEFLTKIFPVRTTTFL